MRGPDNTYSRVVRALKVALPLAALAILSTLFMVSETLDPDAAIPYADVDVEKILREQGVTRPAFGGMTETGVSVSVGADSVRPDLDDRALLSGSSLTATLEFPDGGRIDVASPTGEVDTASRIATLRGGARLESTSGYVIETDAVRTSWETAMTETTGPVEATGPAGELAAGKLTLTRQTETPSRYLLVFTGGVELVYRPGG